MNDLDKFIKYLSNNRISTVDNDELVGPFNTRDNDYLSSDIDLYIIKTEI